MTCLGIQSQFQDHTSSLEPKMMILNREVYMCLSRTGSTWSQIQKLTASDAAINVKFGQSVSISGSSIIIGAPAHDDLSTNADYGRAYIFVRTVQRGRNSKKFSRTITANMIGSVSLLPFLLMKHSWALASTITTLALEALSTAVAHTFSLVPRLPVP